MEFLYNSISADPYALEVTQQLRWDSRVAYPGSCTSIELLCLNASNAAVSSYAYDAYGNRTQETDPEGRITRFTYDPNAQVPGATIPAPATLLQSIDRAYGTAARKPLFLLPTSTRAFRRSFKRRPGAITTTAYDALGRPTLVREAVGVAGVERQTSSQYSLQQRRILTRSDLDATGDGKMITIQHVDQLGRPWRTRQLTSAVVPTDSDTSSGIKVDTQQHLNAYGRYTVTSNPYDSSAEATMGWTLTNLDRVGRPIEVFSTSGAQAPVRGGTNNPPSTGVVTTAYNQTNALLPNRVVLV